MVRLVQLRTLLAGPRRKTRCHSVVAGEPYKVSPGNLPEKRWLGLIARGLAGLPGLIFFCPL